MASSTALAVLYLIITLVHYAGLIILPMCLFAGIFRFIANDKAIELALTRLRGMDKMHMLAMIPEAMGYQLNKQPSSITAASTAMTTTSMTARNPVLQQAQTVTMTRTDSSEEIFDSQQAFIQNFKAPDTVTTSSSSLLSSASHASSFGLEVVQARLSLIRDVFLADVISTVLIGTFCFPEIVYSRFNISVQHEPNLNMEFSVMLAVYVVHACAMLITTNLSETPPSITERIFLGTGFGIVLWRRSRDSLFHRFVLGLLLADYFRCVGIIERMWRGSMESSNTLLRMCLLAPIAWETFSWTNLPWMIVLIAIITIPEIPEPAPLDVTSMHQATKTMTQLMLTGHNDATTNLELEDKPFSRILEDSSSEMMSPTTTAKTSEVQTSSFQTHTDGDDIPELEEIEQEPELGCDLKDGIGIQEQFVVAYPPTQTKSPLPPPITADSPRIHPPTNTTSPTTQTQLATKSEGNGDRTKAFARRKRNARSVSKQSQNGKS